VHYAALQPLSCDGAFRPRGCGNPAVLSGNIRTAFIERREQQLVQFIEFRRWKRFSWRIIRWIRRRVQFVR
jgi:hypothetical protein